MMNPVASRVAAIERELELRQSPERVWKALTDPDELSRWFSSTASLDLRPGGDATFTWAPGHGDSGTYHARVERVDPPNSFAYTWARDAEAQVEDGPSTLVEWELTPTATGGTLLRLRESGFAEEDHRAGNDEGWGDEIEDLRRHLEAA